MFYSRTNNNKTDMLHERTLKMNYDDQISSFEELLEKDNSFSVCHFSIQSLAVEVFKVSSNILAETIIDDLFSEANHKYTLRSKSSSENSVQCYSPCICNTGITVNVYSLKNNSPTFIYKEIYTPQS